MQRIVDPKQTRLFDPFDSVLTEKTRKRLLDGWAGVFRHIILELLPVDTLCGHFAPELGWPTKELYSMAGPGQRTPKCKYKPIRSYVSLLNTVPMAA